MKKRWLSIFVENEIGVLARISGLFSSKSYNLDSLTVGTTEDKTVSRMTISLTSDDKTFEQVKKQLNRCVEVIKVIDLTDRTIQSKELVFIKISGCSQNEIEDIFRFAEVFEISVSDYCFSGVILQCVHTCDKNDRVVDILCKKYPGRTEVVRGGSVVIESVSGFGGN